MPPMMAQGIDSHLLAVVGVRLDKRIVRALGLGELADQVRHIHHACRVELRVVVVEHDEVGSRPGLDGGRDARLQVVGVDGLEVDLDAERLLAFGEQLPRRS